MQAGSLQVHGLAEWLHLEVLEGKYLWLQALVGRSLYIEVGALSEVVEAVPYMVAASMEAAGEQH